MINLNNCFLEITKSCSLRCNHCYIPAKYKKIYENGINPNDLSTEKWFKIIDKLSLMGLKKCTIFGGEPLLRKDFYSILQYAIDSFDSVTVETSGVVETNLSDYKCNVAISFEYSDLEKNTEIRGITKLKGKNYPVFALAKWKLEKITNPKIARFTLYNDTDVFEAIQFAESKNASSTFVPLIPFSREMQRNVPNKDKMTNFFRTIYLLKNRLNHTHFINYPQYWLYDDEKREKYGYIFAERGRICEAGLSRIFINSEGKYSPCMFLPNEFLLGEFLRTDIKNIYIKLKHFNSMINKIPLEGKCNDCVYKNVCNGGCVASYIVKGIKTGINCPIPHLLTISDELMEVYA